jgi:uncharacterized membrane protein YedE/YeeE
MKRAVGAFVTGLLFGAGLLLSGMTQPSKVNGFLDVAGRWDPSLMFVMVGGIATHFALYRWVTRRPSPLLEPRFMIPTRKDIDAKLILGAVLFGVGWGLGGFCPGPGLVAVTQGGNALAFVGAMMLGMRLHSLQAS